MMAEITSLRSWNDYNTFERMKRHFPKMGVSIVLPSSSSCLLCTLRALLGVIGLLVLNLPLSIWVFVLWNRSWKAFLHLSLQCRVLMMFSRTTCGILCWSCFSSSRLAAFSHPVMLKLIWPRSHCLVTLLLIHSFTKKARMFLHDVSSGTIAHGLCSFIVGPLSPPWNRDFFRC